MAADLRLVTDAADADPLEPPAERAGDRPAERGLADPGRADEAQDRAPGVGLQRAHREELEDPFLDLLDVVVVLVEDPPRVARGRGCPRWLRPTAATRSTPGSCGSRRTRPSPAAAARAGRARGRPACGPPRGAPARSSCARSSADLACTSSLSPSSSWIAFSCWRRKYSRWPLSSSDWTCDWIFEPIATTSSSRARISESRRSRLETSSSSSSSCFSSVVQPQGAGDQVASALGSSTLATITCSSSGRYGTCADDVRRTSAGRCASARRAPGI